MNSSTSPPRRWKYDVFLSFRGLDTRRSFVSHLYDKLKARGIHTFMDDEDLRIGKSIHPELLTAIEESRIAIVILSKSYAQSSWCLNELVKIIQCMEELGQIVFPVFYCVEPSDVRHQRRRFDIRREQVTVLEHEDIYQKNEQMEWKHALTEVANLSGFDTSQYKSDNELLDKIVDETYKHSFYSISNLDKGLIGMDSRCEDILSNYLCLQLGGVRIIGIHGMRGIGKTTVARAIYDKIFQEFKGSCFLSNVREISKKAGGLVSLQEKLLSRILGAKFENIDDEHAGAAMIEKHLCNRKVLVVIDDVDDQLRQLEFLVRSRDWFGPGSRVIITTPDVHCLRVLAVDRIYTATGLVLSEALQLLSLKAFKEVSPPEDYLDLCFQILNYAQGLPLALVVLGSFLYGRSMEEWASTIERLNNTPERKIIDVLQISFDGLDKTNQDIFLYIACLYKGKDKDRVTEILDYCELNAVIGLHVLSEKCLITVFNNKVSMHDLLQEMGWEIVRREFPEEPGKRSRLWSHEDIHNVLEKNEGTKAIKGIVIALPKLEVVHWKPEAFSNLSQLRLLYIHNVDLPKGLSCLTNSLRLLEWPGCPLRSLPQNFESNKLIELNLCDSKIHHLWKGRKNFAKLKVIKLCHSPFIVKMPDLTGVQNLEHLDLEGCKKLVGVHESLGYLKKLTVLNLKDCENLKNLPGKVEMECLESLNLSNCSKVKRIPEFVGNMERLSVLNLNETAIAELPESIERLSGLSSLNLSNCRNLLRLPSTMNRLKSIKSLNLSGCMNLGENQESMMEMVKCVAGSPQSPGTMTQLSGGDSKLEEMNRSSDTELSSTHDLLKHVKSSIYQGCEVVWGSLHKFLPSLQMFLPSVLMQRVVAEQRNLHLNLSGLCQLTDLNVSNCNLDERAFANNLSFFPSLVALNISGNNFVHLPSGIKLLSKLKNFDLGNCKRLQELSDLPSNSRLDIRAEGCTLLENLCNVSNLNRLDELYFNFINCFQLNSTQNCNNIGFEMLKKFIYQGTKTSETFQIVLPGSNIPEWFSDRCFGPQLKVELPLDWNNSGLMGFTVCVVFVLHQHHRVDELAIHHFKTFNATHHLVCCLKCNGLKLEVSGRQPAFRFSEENCQVESDHIWLFYVASQNYFGTEWLHNSGTELMFSIETTGPGLQVKEMAVRLIYTNQILTQSSSNSDINLIAIDFEKLIEGESSGARTTSCTLEEL